MSRKSNPASRVAPRQRPPKIDHYVDQFLSTTCETSRRYILELLAPPENWDPDKPYEMRSSDIAKQLGLAKGTTSDHLRQLLDLNLIAARKDGNETYYSLCGHELVFVFHNLLEALDKHYRKHVSTEQLEEEEALEKEDMSSSN